MHARSVSALIGPCLVSVFLAYADAATILSGTVVSIADGDTMTLLVDRTQHKVRLYGIDCPERKQPYGTVARQALADLVFSEGRHGHRAGEGSLRAMDRSRSAQG